MWNVCEIANESYLFRLYDLHMPTTKKHQKVEGFPTGDFFNNDENLL
jgi:hypothetical protein